MISLMIIFSFCLIATLVGASENPVCTADYCPNQPLNVVAPRLTLNDIADFAVTGSQDYDYSGDLLVVPVFQPSDDKNGKDKALIFQALKNNIPTKLSPSLQNIISTVLEDGKFKGEFETEEVIRVFHGGEGASSVKYIALIGLGQEKAQRTDLLVHHAVSFGRKISKAAQTVNARLVGVVLPPKTYEDGLTDLLLGVYDASYQDLRYKKETESVIEARGKKIQQLHFLGCENADIVSSIQSTGRLTRYIASGVDFAKDLVGAPPNSKTPVAIAEEAKKIAEQYNLEIKILGKKECEDLGMGGYLGVQQGSKYPPQFIHLTYKAANSDPNKLVKVALVGKGLTFDSGGYNLKVGDAMIELMKFDMGGCAAVLGCAKAIAQLRPVDLEVHFITPVCENMISSDAMKSGDILVASNGKTIEVLNTDAEGRLILADALVYAEKLGVDGIIDLATLTGACIIGLGNKVAGLYGSNDNFRKAVEDAAKRTDEKLWPLPLEAQYKGLLKSRIADLQNLASSKWGGSVTAALFLQEFVEKTPWCHIDMAGPVWDYSPPGNGGATGFGVKTLVDFLLNVNKNQFKDNQA